MSGQCEKCEKCGKVVDFGDWPFCPHPSTNPERAIAATPTVIYKNKDGKLYYPVGPMARPPKGYEKIELRTVRERDKLEREVNAQESAKLREHWHQERAAWNETVREQSANIDRTIDTMKRNGYSPKLLEKARADMDRKTKDYDSKVKQNANFYIEANHFMGIKHHDD